VSSPVPASFPFMEVVANAPKSDPLPQAVSDFRFPVPLKYSPNMIRRSSRPSNFFPLQFYSFPQKRQFHSPGPVTPSDGSSLLSLLFPRTRKLLLFYTQPPPCLGDPPLLFSQSKVTPARSTVRNNSFSHQILHYLLRSPPYVFSDLFLPRTSETHLLLKVPVTRSGPFFSLAPLFQTY